MEGAGKTTLVLLLAVLGCTDAILTGSTLCDAEHCACPTGGAWGNVTCVCTDTQQEVVLRSNGSLCMPKHTTTLHVEGCARVEVEPLALHDLKHLLRVELKDIQLLDVSTKAFSRPIDIENTWPAIEVLLNHCHIPVLPSFSFQGRTRSIVLQNTELNAVSAFAFASLYATERVELSGCILGTVDPQAFKKFPTERLILHNLTIDNLPSRALVDIEVTSELHLEQVSVQHMQSSSIQVHGPHNVHIRECNISYMEGEAFRVVSEGPVTIQNNYFYVLKPGAFRGFSVGRDAIRTVGRQKLKFHNNTVQNFTEESIRFNETAFEVKLRRMNIARQCSCELLGDWEVFQEVWCLEGDRYREAPRAECAARRPVSLLPILGAVAGGVILLALMLLALCLWRRHHRKTSWISVRSKSKKKAKEDCGRMTIVMPDRRTYRETELHVIVERAEPLVDPMQDHIK